MTSEKRIKQEVVNDGSAGAPGHVTLTSQMTTRPRDVQSGGKLSLPVTISKDFIKELVVSRALERNDVDGRTVADSGSVVPDGEGVAAAVQSRAIHTSQPQTHSSVSVHSRSIHTS